MSTKRIIVTTCIALLELIGIASPGDVEQLLKLVFSPLKGTYDIIAAHVWLQVVICSSFVAFSLYLLTKKVHNRNGEINEGVIFLLASILSWQVEWLLKGVAFINCSLIIFSIFLSIYTLVEITFSIRTICKPGNPSQSKEQGFVSDSGMEEVENDLGRKKYARTIATRLINTDASEEAFAICINGSWGTGKTHFLKYLKEAVLSQDKDTTIVDFAPWLNSSPQQISSEFFLTLRKELKIENRDIDKELKKYAKLLTSLPSQPGDVGDYIDNVRNLLGQSDYTLDELREDVNEKLRDLGHKVFIFIDDIDRLDNSEVLEILRLVRNTAKFPNLIYIASFDSKYVENAINAALKSNDFGERYIDKIFQLEISLPNYEYVTKIYELVDVLKSHLNLNEQDMFELENEILSSTSRGINLNEYLLTFRDVKRYTNLLLTSISQFFVGGKHNDEISLRDLVWIELIHYCDPKVYEEIESSPTDRLLEYKQSNTYSDLFYVYKYSGDKKPMTVSILQWLFPTDMKGHKIESNSIRYARNFMKYFALRPLASQVSRDEFLRTLRMKDENKMLEKVSEWKNDKYDKSQSLKFLFFDVNVKELNVETQLFYIKFLFSYLRAFDTYINRNDIANLFEIQFKLDHFTKGAIPLVTKELISEIDKYESNTSHCIVIAQILSSMYPYEWTDQSNGEDHIYPVCIIDKQELDMQLKKCFSRFVASEHFNGADLCSHNSPVCNFINASYLWSHDYNQRHRVRMLLEDEFIKYTKGHLSIDDTNKILSCFKIVPSQDQFDSTPDSIYLKRKIESHFGTVSFYAHLVKNGLKIDGGDIDKYLRDNKLSGY